MPRYMTWDNDHTAVAVNALDYDWDLVTWLFPPYPLLSLVLERVQEQQIEAILICPGWEGGVPTLHPCMQRASGCGEKPSGRTSLSSLHIGYHQKTMRKPTSSADTL